jgi:hypothetical protein
MCMSYYASLECSCKHGSSSWLQRHMIYLSRTWTNHGLVLLTALRKSFVDYLCSDSAISSQVSRSLALRADCPSLDYNRSTISWISSDNKKPAKPNGLQVFVLLCIILWYEGRNRTGTMSPSPDFESD